MLDGVRERLRQAREGLFGPRHSAWKLGGTLAAAALLALVLVRWDYRIDAAVTLRSQDLVFIPAPYDGYLRTVNVEVGDQVARGTVLAELDTRDLRLEESMSVADVDRYRREAQKAQAVGQLADMQIALARMQQSESRLSLLRSQLANAQVRAPHDGIVVDGELKKNIGSPLRKGDLLMKMAQLGDTYVELEIDQVDVHEVKVGSIGEFALVGRPDRRFALVIDRIDPAASQRDGRNVYLARGRVTEGSEGWWRPGMGGNARLAAGERRLIWVLTHRTVRFLRQAFWL